MAKGRSHYHKLVFKWAFMVGVSLWPMASIVGEFILERFDEVTGDFGVEQKLSRHNAFSNATYATCNVSITTDFTSRDRFFVYPRFTKGPDIELSKMVASQDQNGYLALPRASSTTTSTQDTFNSIFKLEDGQLMVSSLLPSNAENATMYGKVCEVEQDIEDPRASVPPFASRSARWRNESLFISNSSSRSYDKFLCHDGQARNREPAHQWQIQQTCISKKVVDILVPKVAGREDGDILTLENDPGTETIHYCRTSQRVCQDKEKSRQIVLLVDYLNNRPRFILNRDDCFWKAEKHWCRAPEKDGRGKSF